MPLNLPFLAIQGEAETLVLAASSRTASPSPFLTAALRPSAIFGEGDVQLLPNTLAVLRDGKTGFQLGANDNLFDYTYVGNVAHAHLLAAGKLLSTFKTLTPEGEGGTQEAAAPATGSRPAPGKVDGEVFIITNTTPIYFWDFHRAAWNAYYNAAAARPSGSVRVPPPMNLDPICFSREVGLLLASVIEWAYFLLRLGQPRLTRPQANYACMTRFFQTKKAQERLGYAPVWTLQEGIQRSVEWFLEKEAAVTGKKES